MCCVQWFFLSVNNKWSLLRTGLILSDNNVNYRPDVVSWSAAEGP